MTRSTPRPEHLATVRRLARPLEPLPTEVAGAGDALAGIRAVLFDVYGTLLISASGDVGTATTAGEQAFAESCEALGVSATPAARRFA